jgi:hypothetical protein
MQKLRIHLDRLTRFELLQLTKQGKLDICEKISKIKFQKYKYYF